jgi:hypothetical protein
VNKRKRKTVGKESYKKKWRVRRGKEKRGRQRNKKNTKEEKKSLKRQRKTDIEAIFSFRF